MEGASDGFSALFETTKTKLLVLSSLLGVGAIYYMTKNYLQQGHFFPSWYNATSEENDVSRKNLRVIGGKGPVVIKENTGEHGSSGSKQMFQRQRSRRTSTSSRRSKARSSARIQLIGHVPTNERPDINLNKAITELDKSVVEVEEILGLTSSLNYNKRSNQIIEGEIERLRNLLNYAQDLNVVSEKTLEYKAKQQEQERVSVEEDLLEICNVNELGSDSYDVADAVYRHRMEHDIYDSYDSDNDSFISAAESVELEVTEEDVEDYVSFQKKLKEFISKYNKEDFLMYGIEYLTNYGVPIRSVRSELLACENDVDFSVKVFCIRKAFKVLLKSKEKRDWFVKSGKELLISLLRKANHDHLQFSIDYDEIIRYCEDSENWGDIDNELSRRGVCCMNFYDIILDFIILDAMDDLDNPPSTVTAAIQNRWLSVRIKQTALSTAIRTVIKTKRSRLQNPDGFFSKFYNISMHLTPLLAWGFLGPIKELNELCVTFKENMVGFVQDIFSTQKVSYKSVQSLSDDIFRVAEERKEQLLTALA